MTDSQRELHATIDAISTDVARLKAVQTRKQALEPGDPRGSALAEEAVDIATGLLPKTIAERKLVDEISGG
jgi:hypothetical protein